MDPRYLSELGLSPVWQRRREEQTPGGAGGKVVAAPVPPVAVEVRGKGNLPVQRMQWGALQTTAEGCALCPLAKGRQKVAFGVGNQQADVCFVGEGPGVEEDRVGEPFVGPAGKLLDEMLFAIGLSRRENVYIANVVKCRPPKNRVPTVEEARQCLPYLHRQIELVAPKLLVALGRTAAVHLLEREDSIAQLRQKMHEYRGVPLVVTYHPAYLLRSPLEKRKSWEDLRFIRRLLAGEG